MIVEINHNLNEIFILLSSLCLIFGHNLWLVTDKDSVSDTKIKINTGDDFPDGETAISPTRIADFQIHSANGEQIIKDFLIEGNSLTATVREKLNTPIVAAIELFPHPITLEADRFAQYIEDEEAQSFTCPHFIIGETMEPQRESYAKFAKVLVNNKADSLEFFNQQIGHRLEVVLTETLTNSIQLLRVQILFEGKPVQYLRVSSGAENLNGGRYLTHSRTDENGFANIEITQKGHWFIRTHYIRRHSESEKFDWESFWASVTFWV